MSCHLHFDVHPNAAQIINKCQDVYFRTQQTQAYPKGHGLAAGTDLLQSRLIKKTWIYERRRKMNERVSAGEYFINK